MFSPMTSWMKLKMVKKYHNFLLLPIAGNVWCSCASWLPCWRCSRHRPWWPRMSPRMWGWWGAGCSPGSCPCPDPCRRRGSSAGPGSSSPSQNPWRWAKIEKQENNLYTRYRVEKCLKSLFYGLNYLTISSFFETFWAVKKSSTRG